MKFGVRECANITFRAKQKTKIGTATFEVGQPVLYIDTATTSSMEQASTTVYAQGGRGNSRLIAWEGEKTLTFTVTDALISPISLSILSGAKLTKKSRTNKVHVHATSNVVMTVTGTTGTIDLSSVLPDFGANVSVDSGDDAPIYLMSMDADGSLTGGMITSGTNAAPLDITFDGTTQTLTVNNPTIKGTNTAATTGTYFLDYYVIKNAAAVSELQLTPDDFAGYYYVEADTLFRQQSTGVDMPANLTFPNVKIQSNMTISMAGTGDPSTFDFTMDAFPGYTYFDKTKKVLCVIQVIEDVGAVEGAEPESVMASDSRENNDVTNTSAAATGEVGPGKNDSNLKEDGEAEASNP